MERLTERFENGQVGTLGCGNNCKYNYRYCDNALENCPTIAKIFEKLADYEDAEEQGLLLRLPCKVGDTVWNYSYFGLMKYKVMHLGFNKNGDLYFDCECGVAYAIRCYIEDFSKTVFLTKAEAEAKLKEMEGSHE